MRKTMTIVVGFDDTEVDEDFVVDGATVQLEPLFEGTNYSIEVEVKSP